MKINDTTKITIIIATLVITIVAVVIYSIIPNTVNPLEVLGNTILTPISKTVSHSGEAINNLFNGEQYLELETEIDVLKSRVIELEKELAKIESFKIENENLQGLLKIQESNPNFTYVMSEVVSNDANNWFETFTIDKGSIDGISRMNVVVTNDGLLGYVNDVGQNYAKITSLVNSDTAVGARVIRTKDIGVIEGNYELSKSGQCKLSYLQIDTDIVIGDVVETSGLGEVFPRGILIGRVVHVALEDHGMTKYALIEPIVDLTQVRDVFVITSFE